MKLLGGIAGGVVKPVVEAGADVVESREQTKRSLAHARAVAELAASTWRPWLTRLIGWSILAYVVGTMLLAALNAYGVVTRAEWAVSLSGGANALDDLWSRWQTLGAELFSFGAAIIGLYVGSRGVEKVSKNLTGKGVLQSFRGAFGKEPAEPTVRRAPMQEAPTTIDRRPGVRWDPPIEVPEQFTPATWAYGRASLGRLQVAHEDLQHLAHKVLPRMPYDIGILSSTRTEEQAAKDRENGASQTTDSRHLQVPALAIDFGVYIDGEYINGDTEEEVALYLECVEVWRQVAIEEGIPIILGADWTTLVDAGHVELSRAHYPNTINRRPDISLPA